MYDINLKNVKKGRNPFYVFFVVALIFGGLLGSIVVSNYVKLNSLDSSVLSTHVDVNSHIDDEGTTMYSPIYYYVVDGESYICSANSSSSSYPGTENKTVYYDSKNPEDCMSEYSKSSNNIILIFMLIPILFIVIAIFNIIKINKRIKVISELNQKGRLIKNLPYRLENSDISVNNTPIQRVVVDYVLPTGSVITLYGEPRHDRKVADSDGLVDLLIDENNPNNYFIDFEINRLSGNLPSDYYNCNFVNSSNSYYNINNQNNYVNNNSSLQYENLNNNVSDQYKM